MFNADIVGVVVSNVESVYGEAGKSGLVCTPCYYKGEEYLNAMTADQLADNQRCQRCHRFIGNFVTKPSMNRFQYADIVNKLGLMDPEDLVNVISRAVQDRPDIKLPTDLYSGTLTGRLEYDIELDADNDDAVPHLPRRIHQKFDISVNQVDPQY